MQGRLRPFGWFHYLNRAQIIDRVRVGFLGVLPEYQHTGVAAALYIEHFDMAEQTTRKGGEMGWILETNKAMNRGMKAMGGRVDLDRTRQLRQRRRAIAGSSVQARPVVRDPRVVREPTFGLVERLVPL